MISVMKGFEIERKAAPSVTATADRSFLVMENPQEGAGVSDGGDSGVSSETRVSSMVDFAGKILDLEGRVSGKGELGGSGSLGEEELVMEIDGGDEDMAYMDEENRVFFLESSDQMNGFRIGDMVWGKVKSHPWWPGHIFNEAFASPSVRRMRREGFVLVAFFGDSSYGWFDPAELIPFEPHFYEKSRQTTSRSFMKAVEEAMDEASRRGALGVACLCRNKNNFRSTTVAGYFSVDVVGYEPGGIYSSRQIKKSRDSFVPVELISFVQQLPLAGYGSDEYSIEWIQTIARLLAYRTEVFEEFDETYAQAFGVEPVRPSLKSIGVFDQTDRFAPRGTPLSGPLVVAESLGERRSSARQASHKTANFGKKSNYVLKRRDDLPAAATSSLLDFPFASQHLNHGFFPSNHLLRKSEKPPPPPPDAIVDLDSTMPPGFPQQSEPVDVENEAASSMGHAIPMDCSRDYVDNEFLQKPALHLQEEGMASMKKEKAPKRALEEINERGEVKKKKKKKKKDGFGADQFPASLGRSLGVVELLSEDEGIDMELPLGLDLSSLRIPQLLTDLSFVALDPFYDIERDAPAIVRHVFLRFRSLVYQKSLVLPASSETAAPAQPSAGEIGASVGREGRESSSSSSKPPKPGLRFGDSTKAVRKRDPSDRQEERSLRKMEKMKQLKQLASKKKAAISQKNNESQHSNKDTKDSSGSSAIAATEAPMKQDRPPSPKLLTPTFLIMKFPPRSTLPSASNLKARFARFGPLDLMGTRVFWKNYTCRVLFKHKSNAQLAFDFVQNNDLFGQVKVIYHLRDQEVSGPDQPSDSQNKPSDPLQNRHGSANLQKPSFSQANQSQTQLKSILKKPGGDDSGPNCAPASISITKEIPRVKFMLNGDDDRSSEPPPPPPSKLVPFSTNGSGQTPLLSPVDQINRQPPKSAGFFRPPLLQPLQPPSRGFEMHPSRFPPPLTAALQHALPLPHLHSSRGFLPPLAPSNDPREKTTAVDISGPMLSLLLKCNDIVSNVKSSLGYDPYHSL